MLISFGLRGLEKKNRAFVAFLGAVKILLILHGQGGVTAQDNGAKRKREEIYFKGNYFRSLDKL